MSLNCRPGDLAYTVAPVIMDRRGRVLRVLRASTIGDHARLNYGWAHDLPCWVCESSEGETICADISLRPIRDPGDDARDEALDWLPVPAQHKEPA